MNKTALLPDFQTALRKAPRLIRKSPLGKFIFNLAQLIPHEYNTSKYSVAQAKAAKQPIKIVFSGMGDNQAIQYTHTRFKQRYGQDAPIYTFGWSQLPQALAFIKKVGKDKPCIVYGFFWGGQAAQKFLNKSGANIIGAHFLDPMRKDVGRHTTLKNKKKIPTDFTAAQKYAPGDFRRTAFDVLRYRPAQTMQLLGPVSSHGAVNQWLQLLQKPQMNKAASIKRAIKNYYRPLTFSSYYNKDNIR